MLMSGHGQGEEAGPWQGHVVPKEALPSDRGDPDPRNPPNYTARKEDLPFLLRMKKQT